MAQIDTKIAARSKVAAVSKGEGLPFTRMNYLILAAGLLAIILGYLTLSQGSITLAPILLVLGYCVIFPIGILYRGKDTAPESKSGA